MPYALDTAYKPRWYLKNGHINTLYAYYNRKPEHPNFTRETIQLSDGDFLDCDTLKKTSNTRCLVIFHGLEGSTSSQYVLGLSKFAHVANWDIIAVNYRGCSGRENLALYSYHSGKTEDVHAIVEHYAPNYKELAIVGFSLGGNLVLKYSGEDNAKFNNKISKTIAISTPIDLSKGAVELKKLNNRLYTKNFIHALSQKILRKAKQFPNDIDLEPLDNIKEVWDFDEHYTSKLNGFKGAEDYYAQCSCGQFLPYIQNKTLIINALDDSFIPTNTYPFDQSKENQNIYFHPTKYGGHVGFSLHDSKIYWHEKKILSFLEEQ